MTYADLVGFGPSELGVGLGSSAGTGPEAVRATSSTASYAILEELADGVAYVFCPPHTASVQTPQSQGLLIAGVPGTSEAGLMSVVAAVAESVELGKEPGKWEALQHVGPLAGAFKVVRVPIAAGETDVLCFLWCRFNEALEAWGLSGATMHVPNAGQERFGDFVPGLDRIMAAFRDAFPGHGLLLVVESDSTAKAPLPESFLAEISHKSAEQQALVREYLRFFAPAYGDMESRLEEFITSFPLHPDYVATAGHIKLPGKPPLSKTVAQAVERLLGNEVPLDRPGLLAFDSYWEELLTPALRCVPEVEGVLESARRAELKILHAVCEATERELAFRLIHGLCVHRLTRADIYSHEGITAEELCDRLCLFEESVPGASQPREMLLSHVKALLVELHKLLGGRVLSFNSRRAEFYLHFSKFRRFVKPELVLHWVNAVPFLLLLATGALMLGSRFIALPPGLFEWVVSTHKASAAFWLLFLPLAVLARPKVHWRHIHEMLRWGKEDVVWVVQSLRSLHNTQAPMSPAGRFNTGQKINACLVMLYFVGFGGTGLLMWFKASILVPWYVHTAFFLSAMGSVGGHLFLALLNPSTRIALAGIFHGWAPMEYVEHHHALSLPRSLRLHLGLTGGRTLLDELLGSRKELALLAVAGVLVAVDVVAFNNWKIESIKNKFAKSFSDCIKPSELSTRHRLGSAAASCTKCHSYTGEIPNSKCEDCHGYIKQRRDNLVGYHGTLKGDCVQCHKEHPRRAEVIVPLDREKFDHNLASFKREGRHAQVPCDECHKKKRSPEKTGIYFIGLKHESCRDCHRDQHGKQFAAACTTCHSSDGWKGKDLKFDHARDSAFILAGKHKTTDCAKCHKPKSANAPLGSAMFKGTKDKCANCHEDPHRNQLTANCAACHSPAGWTGDNLAFRHNKDSSFKLVGAHETVACAKCHAPSVGEPLARARFKGLKMECADCHKDPHDAQFSKACTQCHADRLAWKKNLRFDHNADSRFALAGNHASVDCVKCHQPRAANGLLASARFKGLDTNCSACHKVEHPLVYGQACLACHNTDRSWPKKRPGFEHIYKQEVQGENLSGKHLTARCSACHDGVRVLVSTTASKIAYDCWRCHQADDPHKQALGTSCVKCHGMDGWKGEDLRFNHETMASFVLDQWHRKVACTKCHENGHWKPLDSKCQACHSQSFLDQKK